MTDSRPLNLVDLDEARAILEARHGDPFEILGLHERDGESTVTAFVPDATAVAVLTHAGDEAPLDPVSGAPGLFVGLVDTDSAYRLRASNEELTWEFEDPYRFGPVLGEIDEHLIGEGTHHRLWRALGAHIMEHEGVQGVHFAVWAPNAERVSVTGDFNSWDGRRSVMRRRGTTGVWEIFLPELGEGTVYKYEIRGPGGEILSLKADPVAFGSEHPPRNASVVRRIDDPTWSDDEWMATRAKRQSIDAPISIYEVHLGSWKRSPDDGTPLSYRQLAEELVDYAFEMGFTHIELLPISEHPFDGSWGYQPIGLFAPTVRYGTPEDFRALVNAAHNKGLGVILDWVPAHFPTDPHGLGWFDGTALYEHADPKEGFHQDWSTLIYNYGRTEVANFLISNALYWLEEYHVDGLRVDAVASMLYRDYSREEGEWIPNVDGGRESYEAIELLRRMNTVVYGQVPGIMTLAEESTAFGGVSREVDKGGLGFGFKWNMGWMNDTLRYMQLDSVYRKHHHDMMTFGMQYAYTENFVLPISHDEVVHGKGSMVSKMAGEGTDKFANLRTYYAFMWTHPGKKLLFMGCEFAQWSEWNHNSSLDWHLLEFGHHSGMQALIRDLNGLLRETPALYRYDTSTEGFQWLEVGDADQSVFAYIRRGEAGEPEIVVALNFTPVERSDYRLGFPVAGSWREVLRTDAQVYGGESDGACSSVETEPVAWHDQQQSALVTLPPLTAIIFEQGSA